MPSTETDVLSIAEIADRLGMGIRQTYRYARNGDLPFVVRIGVRFIAPKRAFERWLETAGQDFNKTNNSVEIG